MGLLGDIYSTIDTKKRQLKGLLADPMGTIEQGVRNFAEDQNRMLNLAANAYPMAGDKTVLNSPEQIAQFRSELADKGAAQAMAATIYKNPSPFNVSHGSNDVFDKFQQGMGKTAEHIYTVPAEIAGDASVYGKNVYTAQASPKKMLDFSEFNSLDKPTLAAMKKAAKDAGITDKYNSFDDFLQNAMDGQLYQKYGSQSVQNSFLRELFGRFDAVKMPDAGMGGTMSKSVVFENPGLLSIFERNGVPLK